MKAIMKNLKDQILTDDTTIMYCPFCLGQYSAHRGDYWDHIEDYEFTCCHETMLLGNFKKEFIEN